MSPPRLPTGARAGLSLLAAVGMLVAGATPAAPEPAPHTPVEAPQPATHEPSQLELVEDAEGTAAGWWDVSARVRGAVNDWLRDVIVSALSPALSVLGRSLLTTPQVAEQPRVVELWWASAGLANSLFVLLVLAGGLVVMGHETVQNRYSVKEVAPRLVVGLVAANTSLLLATHTITSANALSVGLLGQGAAPERTAEQLRQLVLGPVEFGGPALLLLGLVAALMAVLLLGVYIVRVAVVMVLVIGAPLALACHALPQLDGVARLWWRAFAACMAVQLGHALVLVAAAQLFFGAHGRALLGLSASTVIDLLVLVCLLWLLLRIPVWASRAVVTGRGSHTLRTVRYYVSARAARAVLPL